MKSTPETRERIRVVAKQERDQYDYAVLDVLDDFDMLEKAYDNIVYDHQQNERLCGVCRIEIERLRAALAAARGEA